MKGGGLKKMRIITTVTLPCHISSKNYRYILLTHEPLLDEADCQNDYSLTK